MFLFRYSLFDILQCEVMSVLDRPVYRLFGTPINALSMADTLSLVDRTIASRGRLLIGVVNAAKLVNMRRGNTIAVSIQT